MKMLLKSVIKSLDVEGSFPFADCKINAIEIINDLLLVIQNIVAETATVSGNILRGSCLECKIVSFPNSPIVTLHYELDSNRNVVRNDSSLENENLYVDGKDETPVTSGIVKQEMPELLAVLNSSKQEIQEDGEDSVSLGGYREENDFPKMESSSMLNSESSSVVSIEIERIEVSPDLGLTFDAEGYDGSFKNVAGGNAENFAERNTSEFEAKRKGTASSKKNYSCSYCGKLFQRKYHHHRHEMIHTKEKPYPCSYCGKRFLRKDAHQHHEMIHTGKKPYVCRYCGKSFSTKKNNMRHETTHTEEKPYSCGDCGKSFTLLEYLLKHQRIHVSTKSVTGPLI